MKMNNQTRPATVAEELMAIDVFGELLASADPAQMGKKLTEQLREVTGAKTVLLVSHAPGSGRHTLIHANPERRSGLFSSPELELLCPACIPGTLPGSTADFPDDNPIKALLADRKIETILRFPLTGDHDLVATLFLLDLPGLDRIDETASIVSHLSPVIALALRNSLSNERIEKQAEQLERLASELEKKVEERTEELEESNRNLNTSLREKETLIRELYHRTKNTLQIVSGILKLQAVKFPDNRPVCDLVEITDNRIQAISLVHQMLYTSKDLSRIPIQDYITELVGLIKTSHGSERHDVSFSLDIENRSYLLDTAIPLGLILTELVTNTYKYAFEPGSGGQVTVKLMMDGEENTRLSYADDGKGVPDGFDFRGGQTLGMQLVFNIVEQQLRGSVEFRSGGGLSCLLAFPKALYSSRV